MKRLPVMATFVALFAVLMLAPVPAVSQDVLPEVAEVQSDAPPADATVQSDAPPVDAIVQPDNTPQPEITIEDVPAPPVAPTPPDAPDAPSPLPAPDTATDAPVTTPIGNTTGCDGTGPCGNNSSGIVTRSSAVAFSRHRCSPQQTVRHQNHRCRILQRATTSKCRNRVRLFRRCR